MMNTTDNTTSGVGVAFEWDTDGAGSALSGGYTIDTTAGKWTLSFLYSGGTTGAWSCYASSLANMIMMYALWGDTQMSFTDNDTVIVRHKLTVDSNATVKGVLGTGAPTYSWALIPLAQPDPTNDNVANIIWDTTASRTLTVDGNIVGLSHAGIRMGTAASPVAAANQAILNFKTYTIGASCGIAVFSGYSGQTQSRFSVFIYGATPTVRKTTFAQDFKMGTASIANGTPSVVTGSVYIPTEGEAIYLYSTTGSYRSPLTALTKYYARNVSGSTYNLSATPAGALINTTGTNTGTTYMGTMMVTTDVTGWTAGKRIGFGAGVGPVATPCYPAQEIDLWKIGAISGTEIIPDHSYGSGVHKTGGPIFVLDEGYGCKIMSGTNAPYSTLTGVSNWHMEGCENDGAMTFGNSAASLCTENAGCSSKIIITKNTVYNSVNGTQKFLVGALYVPPEGIELSHNYSAYPGYNLQVQNLVTVVSGVAKSGAFLVDNNIAIASGVTNTGFGTSTTSTSVITYTNNWVEGHGNSGGVTLQGFSIDFSHNTIWGMNSATVGALSIGACVSLTGHDNSIQNCKLPMNFNNAVTINCKLTNSHLGDIVANIGSVNYNEGILMQWQEDSPIGSLITPATTYINQLAPNSYFRVTNNNGLTDNDLKLVPFGIIQRTKSTLTDTVVRTAGGSAMRFAPASSLAPLVWEQTIPTGNIQNKSMEIGVWVKINNAAYYAGTNQLPRLTITYDNGTVAYCQAAQATGWQYLPVPFMPVTTYGSVTAKLTAMTDAAGANAYVYWDDWSVLYPAGYIMDASGMDGWANAEPVMPTISTLFSAKDVWQAQTSTMTGTGTMGKLITKLLTTAKFLGLK
jgi:hypothetical protein